MRTDEYQALLKETETMLTKLASLYELWFNGVERLEPHVARRAAEKRMDFIRKTVPNNTALRFRAQTLLQRWTTLREHWAKVARRIEEGTYHRDVLRAKRRAAEQNARAEASTEAKPDGWAIDFDDVLSVLDDAGMDDLLASFEAAQSSRAKPAPGLDDGPPTRPMPVVPSAEVAKTPLRLDEAPAGLVARPAPVAPRSGANPPAPPPPPSAGLAASTKPARPMPPAPPSRPVPPAPPPKSSKPAGEDAEMRALYTRYVEKRRENNERVDNVRFETIAERIRTMRPDLEKKHAGKRVDFEVVVKDGKVGFKPVVR